MWAWAGQRKRLATGQGTSGRWRSRWYRAKPKRHHQFQESYFLRTYWLQRNPCLIRWGSQVARQGWVTSGCQSLSRSLWQRKPLWRGVGNRKNPAHTAVSKPARLGRCSAWHGGGGQVICPRPPLAWAGHVTPWSSAPASVRRDGWTGHSPCQSRRASGLIRAGALACQSQLPG